MSLSYDALKVDNDEATGPLQLFYKITSTQFDGNVGWNLISGSDYQPGEGANTTPFSFDLKNLNLGDGDYLTFRFLQTQPPTNAPVAIDNLKLTVIPEPQTLLLAALGMLLWISRRNIRRVSQP